MKKEEALKTIIEELKANGFVSNKEALDVAISLLQKEVHSTPNYSGKGYLKFDKAFREYIEECQDNALSKHTVRSYKHTLTVFREYIARKYSESDPDRECVRDFRDELKQSDLKKSTVNEYMMHLSNFFSWACDEDRGYYQLNPVSKKFFVKISAEEKGYLHIMDPEDIWKLWVNDSNKAGMGGDRNWKRDYAIACVLLDSKLRNSELLNLRISDIDFQHKELFVRCGKGGKSRTVEIRDISITAMQLYLQGQKYGSDDYLFFRRSSKGNREPMTSSTLSYIVENHVHKVTGKHGFRTHSLRHAGAMLDLNSGMPMENIQANLGHSNMVITQRYTDRLQNRKNREGFKEAVDARKYWENSNKRLLDKLSQCGA